MAWRRVANCLKGSVQSPVINALIQMKKTDGLLAKNIGEEFYCSPKKTRVASYYVRFPNVGISLWWSLVCLEVLELSR
jgi:hypothetical protein